MVKKGISFVLLFLIANFVLSCTSLRTTKERDLEKLPKVDREFRAAWVATVANINWPSKPTLTTEEQKKEAIILLDLLKENNFNAVVFQARPQCDALYKSELEPWSFYLTGKQGQAPSPYYDPLEFWIEEAHKRSLELHVWMNPYRAHHIKGGEVSDASVVKTRPELVVGLKSGYWWLDPAKKETQDYSYNVVMDIVKRYNIDGIHFDDYFYPYPSYNDDKDFPDDETWEAYLEDGGKLTRNDWRRENVNKFIQRVNKGIKKQKSHVKFGLSPFGIWRPNNPESIEGFDQYDKLFADAKLWLNEGWIDYWAPQLYWKISNVQQSYPVLLGWWKNENKKGRHLWPGINTVRENNKENTYEVINQVMVTRGMLPDSPGNIHWSIGPLLEYKELSDALKNGPYKKQALVPATPWLDNEPPYSPEVNAVKAKDKIQISWTHKNSKDVFCWIVYYKYGDSWNYKVLNWHNQTYETPITKNDSDVNKVKTISMDENIGIPLTKIAVSAVDKVGNESEPSIITLNN